MRRIDSKLKKLYVWNIYLILKPLIPFSLYSVGILVLHTLNSQSRMFLGINKNNFSFFGFSNLSFFCVCFYNFKKENIYF